MKNPTTITKENKDAANLRRAISEKLPAATMGELALVYGFLKDNPTMPLEQLPLEDLRAAFPHPSIDDAADLAIELRDKMTADQAEELTAQICKAIEPAEAKSQYWRINLIVREAYCRGFAAGVYDAQEAARLTIEEMAESN